MKKRPNRKKLVESGLFARDILADRGIIKKDSESIIEEILSKEDSPMLPGGSLSKSARPYLPSPWTINTSRRVVYDIARLWEYEIRRDKIKKIRGIDFFAFAIKELNRLTRKLNKEIKKKIAENEYDLSLLNKKETIDAMKMFLVDSFAISVISKSHSDVSEYIVWFDDWTKDLLRLWPKSVQSVDSKLEITYDEPKG